MQILRTYRNSFKPLSKVDFHCTDFQEVHNYRTASTEDLLYSI